MSVTYWMSDVVTNASEILFFSLKAKIQQSHLFPFHLLLMIDFTSYDLFQFVLQFSLLLIFHLFWCIHASLLESQVCSALDGEGIALSSPLKGSLGQVKMMEIGSLLVQKGGNHHTHTGLSLDGAELVKLKEEMAKQIAGQSLGQRKAACLAPTEGPCSSTPLENTVPRPGEAASTQSL